MVYATFMFLLASRIAPAPEKLVPEKFSHEIERSVNDQCLTEDRCRCSLPLVCPMLSFLAFHDLSLRFHIYTAGSPSGTCTWSLLC